MLSAIHGDEFFRHCYNPLGEVMDAAALLNSAINFLLYCIMSKQFRRTFIETFNLQGCASCCERSHKKLFSKQLRASNNNAGATADVNGNAQAGSAHAHVRAHAHASAGAALNGMGYTNKTIKEEDEAELTAMLAHPEAEEVKVEVATDETSPGAKGVENGAMRASDSAQDGDHEGGVDNNGVIDTQV